MSLRRRLTLPAVCRHVLLITLLLIFGYPLAWMGVSALRTDPAVRSAPFALPTQPTTENFSLVIRNAGFGRAYLNSLAIVASSVALAVAASALAAFAFARIRFRGRGPLFLLFLAGMIIPVHVTLIPLNRLLGPNALNLKNTLLALIGPYVGFSLPVSILILRGAFAALPVELEDAARIDGCSTWAVFRHIALPLVKPALATVIIFNFLTLWNEFAFALTLISRHTHRTLPLALWQFKGEHGMNIAHTCAALCASILPVLLVYLLAQKHIIRGLTAGALKQ